MTGIFQHILVPYNGVPCSKIAFKKAVTLAQSIQAKITVLTCLEDCRTFGFFKTKANKQEVERESRWVEKQYEDLREYAGKHGVAINTKIVKNGVAAEKILQFADKHEVDLIIMGKKKSVSRYEKTYYQSTVESVFRNAHCPILVI